MASVRESSFVRPAVVRRIRFGRRQLRQAAHAQQIANFSISSHRGHGMSVSAKYLIGQIAGMAIVFSVLLFVPAGTAAWPAAWVFLVMMFAFTIALSVWLMRFDPELLEERMSGVGKSDQKTWDKVLLAFVGIAFFAWLTVMGVDRRFHLSRVPLWLGGVGAVMLVLSFGVFYLTFRENTYLSPAVRVQKERSQVVVSTGPYARVRHPLYAGFVLYTFGTALLLGSWLGVVGALVLIVLVAYRAVMEERVLREELDGYSVYMNLVRWRLVPHVW